MITIAYNFEVEEIELVIEALEEKAHTESGTSQAPDLINMEDTAAWKLAQEIKYELKGYAG